MKIFETVQYHLDHKFQYLGRNYISFESLVEQPEWLAQRLENEADMTVISAFQPERVK